MQRMRQGLATALLFALLFGTGGCRPQRQVYVSGLETEHGAKETQTGEESPEEHSQESKDANSELNRQGSDDGMQDAASQGSDDGMQNAASRETVDGVQSGAVQGTADGLEDAQPSEAGYVHICGAVNAPGVYPIYEGMRLFEAVELAGGFAPDADEVWLNQAQLLQDGQRWYIYTRTETQELQDAQPAQDGVAQPQGALGQVQDTGQGASGQIQPGQDIGQAQTNVTAPEGTADNGKVNLNTAD